MTALPSIRRRLSGTVVALTLAWSLAVSAVVSGVVGHEVDELMDATLQESAQVLTGLLSYRADLQLSPASSRMPARPHKEDLVWQLVDARQAVLLRSHEAPPEALVPATARGFVDVGESWRVYADDSPGQGLVLVVAQPAAERQEARADVMRYTAGAALLVGLLCAGWFRSRVQGELRPVYELSEALAHFDPLGSPTTLPQASRQELQPMRQAIAELGSRLARHVVRERAITAHAAHALRTPLAGLVAQLAAAQRVAAAQVQPELVMARQAADRLRRVVAALLTLFRSGTDLQWQPIDLHALVNQVPAQGLAVSVEAEQLLRADPDLLAAALANVLDNAVRHGASSVTIGLQVTQGQAFLAVGDDGPGLPEAERSLLQEELRQQRYEGRAGLGLMLADLVARAHGGELRLPPCTRGFRVELRLAGQTFGRTTPDAPRAET